MADRVWRSPLLLSGLLVWVVCLAAWGVAWAFDSRVALAMGASFGTFLVGGKLAGIPTGLSLGLPPWLVGLVVSVPDAGAVLVTYPLLDRGWDAAARWSHLLASVRKQALADSRDRQGLVVRFGSWGLLALSLTPVAFISPIVVAAIGQLMGLSRRGVLVPVLAGMAIMTAALVALFGAGLGAAARIHPALPFVVTGLIVTALILRELVLRWQARTRPKEEA